MTLTEFSTCHLQLEPIGSWPSDAFFTDMEPRVIIGLADSPFWLWLEEQLMNLEIGENVLLKVPEEYIDTRISKKPGNSNASCKDFMKRNFNLKLESVEPSEPSGSDSYQVCSELSDDHKDLIKWTFNLKLVSVEPSEASYELCAGGKLKRADLLKECGSRSFRNGHVQLAFHRYKRALQYVICAGPRNKKGDCENPKEFDRLRSICYFNLAACQLKTNSFTCVVANCSKGLESDPENVKGLFRRSQALGKLGRYEEGIEDLKLALKFDSTNKTVQKLLRELTLKLQNDRQSSSKAMSKMFS